MSFGEFEASGDRGEPIELYLFIYGSGAGQFIGYTDAEQPLTRFEPAVNAVVTYAPIPIASGKITSSGTLDRQNLTVAFPENAALTDLFRYRPTSSVVSLIKFQGHANDPAQQFLSNWNGRVVGFNIADNETELTCQPAATAMQRNGLRRHWQYGCPHFLYSQGPGLCNASKAAATANFLVAGFSANVLTLDLVGSINAWGASSKYSDWGNPERRERWAGGLVEWTSPSGRAEIRSIVRIEPNSSLRLSSAMEEMPTSATVQLIYGCNHKTGIPSLFDGGDCLPVHNNILNFGGDPWIPLENPVGLKNIYR